MRKRKQITQGLGTDRIDKSYMERGKTLTRGAETEIDGEEIIDSTMIKRLPENQL